MRSRYPDAKKAFSTFDANGNGSVSKQEFSAVIDSQHLSWKPEQVFHILAGSDKLLSQFELNKLWKTERGKLLKRDWPGIEPLMLATVSNFGLLLRLRYGAPKRAFENLDQDNSGQ